MTIALFTGLVIFAVVYSTLVILAKRKDEQRTAARLEQALAPRTTHQLLMDKYQCHMSDEEMAELNRRRWQ